MVRDTPLRGLPALPPGADPEAVKNLAKSEIGTRAASVARDAKQATAFTDDEEAFFRAGAELDDAPTPSPDTFEDLDEGYQPKTFFQRLFNRPAAPPQAVAKEKPSAKRKGSKKKKTAASKKKR